MIPTRRLFFLGAAALVAAPSLVRASSLMPVSVWDRQPRYYGDGIHSDAPHLQWVLDHADPTKAVKFKPGTYYLGESLRLTKPFVVLDAESVKFNMNLVRGDYAPVIQGVGDVSYGHLRFGTVDFGNKRGCLFQSEFSQKDTSILPWLRAKLSQPQASSTSRLEPG